MKKVQCVIVEIITSASATLRWCQNSSRQVQDLLDQVRELKDVNSRLFKLVSDKDFEIRRLKKKIEEDQIALAGTAAPILLLAWYGMPGDSLILSVV